MIEKNSYVTLLEESHKINTYGNKGKKKEKDKEKMLLSQLREFVQLF